MSISRRPVRQYSGTTRGAGGGWTDLDGRLIVLVVKKLRARRPARSSGRS